MSGDDTKPFDPTDSKYQVDSSLPPDKESTWNHGPETDQWMLKNNSIRGAVTMMKDALSKVNERGKLTSWTVDSIQTWWKGYVNQVRSIHDNGEQLISFYKTRFHYPESLMAGRKTLMEEVDNLGKVVDGISEGGDVSDLQQAWLEYESKLLPRLEEEEQIGLPLFRAYFTLDESGPEVRKALEAGSNEELGGLIYFMSEDKFRSVFMKEMGIPAFVWYLAFKGKLSYYNTNMVCHIDALKSGTPPQQQGGFRSFFGR